MSCMFKLMKSSLWGVTSHSSAGDNRSINQRRYKSSHSGSCRLLSDEHLLDQAVLVCKWKAAKNTHLFSTNKVITAHTHNRRIHLVLSRMSQWPHLCWWVNLSLVECFFLIGCWTCRSPAVAPGCPGTWTP